MAHLSQSLPVKIIIQTCPGLLPKIYFNLPLLIGYVIISVALLYLQIMWLYNLVYLQQFQIIPVILA